MIDMTNLEDVKQVQRDLNVCFGTEEGGRVMGYLEDMCGYNTPIFNPDNINLTLINEGKRQVVISLKSLLTLKAEQIVELYKRQGE